MTHKYVQHGMGFIHPGPPPKQIVVDPEGFGPYRVQDRSVTVLEEDSEWVMGAMCWWNKKIYFSWQYYY
jgi:hypothetical protein